MSRFFSIGIVAVFLGAGLAGIATGKTPGFGAIGDSMTDEYQFAEYGQNAAALNWLEQLAEYRSLNFGAFSETSRGEPRREGYAYNWARAGDTTDDLLDHGQHIGLGSQIIAGQVDLAFCLIGENDFTRIDNLINLYYGTVPWLTKVNEAFANLRTAVNAVLAVDPNVKLVLATIPEIELNPAVRANFPDLVGRRRVRLAIAEYNRRLLEEIALGNPRIAVADIYGISLDILEKYQAGQNLFVGGYEVDLNGVGNAPNNIIVADCIHPGTIAQGLMANEFIRAMNTFGYNVAPFTEEEILRIAGVELLPEPATLTLLTVGGAFCFRRRRGGDTPKRPRTATP